eukprot:NODE_4455_length_579_cov_95.079245_g3232_i0.p5 GENE.NODE_4455_length_579_cov_95.079245_g3232_i0~~NODE_4455_length_579_cov_95.079245_g3232_i0.p5  ORF type:complete len:62 (+),score=1.83 NODE_4455_length_579_cov_95.079245_g3232_i0:282-467(+)
MKFKNNHKKFWMKQLRQQKQAKTMAGKIRTRQGISSLAACTLLQRETLEKKSGLASNNRSW